MLLTGPPHLCHTAVMRGLKFLLVSLCVGALSQARADDPPPPPPPAVSATPNAIAPSTESTPAASAAKSEEPEAARLEAQAKRLKAVGYKREKIDGVMLFCRNESRLGTRFETKTCGEGDVIEKSAQYNKEMMQKVQRQNSLSPEQMFSSPRR
jgi:hypothetical protein